MFREVAVAALVAGFIGLVLGFLIFEDSSPPPARPGAVFAPDYDSTSRGAEAANLAAIFAVYGTIFFFLFRVCQHLEHIFWSRPGSFKYRFLTFAGKALSGGALAAGAAILLAAAFGSPDQSRWVPNMQAFFWAGLAGTVLFAFFSIGTADSGPPYRTPSVTRQHIGGTKVHTNEGQTALGTPRPGRRRRRGAAARKQSPTTFSFGALTGPLSSANLGFLAIGGMGTGKTIAQRRQIQSVLSLKATSHALFLDAKCRSLEFLAGIVGENQIVLLNVADKRTWAWDIAEDIAGDPDVAAEIATSFIPPNEEAKEPMWSERAGSVLATTFRALSHLAGTEWGLWDAIIAMDSDERLAQVFRACPYTADAAAVIRPDSNTWYGIKSQLTSHLERVRPAAEAMRRAWLEGSRLSLRHWAFSRWRKLLVIGAPSEYRAMAEPMNRAVFNYLSTILLSSRRTDALEGQYTWLFLDELQAAGRLNGLHTLVTEGRESNVCVSACMHNLGELISAYGSEAKVDTITAGLSHKAIFTTEDPRTQEFAAKCIGKRRISEERVSVAHSWGTNEGQEKTRQSGTNVQTSIEEREEYAVEPSKLRSIPRPSATQAAQGYYITPSAPDAVYLLSLAPRDFPPKASANSYNFMERPEGKSLHLKPWDERDLGRLNLVGKVFIKSREPLERTTPLPDLDPWLPDERPPLDGPRTNKDPLRDIELD